MSTTRAGRMLSGALLACLLPDPAMAADHGMDAGAASIDLVAGGMVIVAPKYEGAKSYEVRAFPFIAPAGFGSGGDGFVQFRSVDDVRIRVLNANGFEAGPLIGWRFGREDSDATRLRWIGDVDGGLLVGAYVAYRAGPVLPFITYQHQVTGDDTGGVLRFGIEHKTSLAHGITLTTTVGTSYADNHYMDAFFSITPAQSAASLAGLGVFNANAGFKDVYIGVAGDVPLAKDWTLKLSARYSHLVGDAGNSPVVESESQFYAGVGLTYRLGLK